MKTDRFVWLAVLAFIFLTLIGGWGHPGFAQAQGIPGEWAPLTQIYASERIDLPVLTADASGALHVLWWGLTPDQTEGEVRVILYARWDGSRWTTPTDVLVNPKGGEATFPEAVVDLQGTLHVVYGGPSLYYSAAPAWAAESARNWSSPREIGGGKVIVSSSGLAMAPDGSIHVVFADGGGEVYHVASLDGGKTWSAPRYVSLSPNGTATQSARLAVDASGRLHVVWTRIPMPEAYPPLGVFYAQSSDGGENWSMEIELAGPDYGEAEILADRNGDVHVVYNGRGGVGGRYHRWSRDHGRTWSDRIDILPPGTAGGLTGHPWLGVDSQNVLYFISGGGALLSAWDGQRWSGPYDLTELATVPLEWVEQPALAVVAGNQLHIVFWDGRKRLWHTWRLVSAPAEPLRPYPTLTPTPPAGQVEATPTPTSSVPAATATALDRVSQSPLPGESNPADALLVGIVPAVLLIVIVLAAQLLRRRV